MLANKRLYATAAVAATHGGRYLVSSVTKMATSKRMINTIVVITICNRRKNLILKMNDRVMASLES